LRHRQVNAGPVLDASGRIMGSVSVVRDITKQKRIEEELRESGERLRMVLQASSTGTFEVDLLTGEGSWNDTEYELLGLRPGEIPPCPENFFRYVHPEDLEPLKAVWEEAKLAGKLDAEFRIVRADGEVRWLAGKGGFIFDRKMEADAPEVHGRPLRFMGVNFDITERKRVEVALRESQGHVLQQLAEIEAIYNSAHVGLCVFDRNLKYVRINERLAEINGVPAAEHLGKSPGEIVSELAELAEDISRRIFETGRPVTNIEFSGTTRSQPGVQRYWIEHWLPLKDEQGDVAGINVVVEEVTERKRNEAALKKLNDELESRVEERTAELREKDQIMLLQSRQAAMGEMISNIAHQWRQPLNALGLTIQQLALFYEIGELNKEYIENVVSSSMEIIQHMSRTIDDFRNYFKPDKEKVEFRLSEVIANALSLVDASFKKQHIGIELVAKDDHVIHGYRNEFTQVLLNILNNARDALTERGSEDPRVTITICSEEGRVVVIIADNAGGIPEEILDRIFDPYFTTKGPQAGTGIGLFMSKTIIEKNMGGMLTVRNTDNGAEFRIEV
jgi:PAS domain S-box-containing protein